MNLHMLTSTLMYALVYSERPCLHKLEGMQVDGTHLLQKDNLSMP